LCWDSGNVARTGFLLYSIWPRFIGDGNGGPSDDCESSGFFCISDIACTDAGGSELGAYSGCTNFNEVCCSEDKLPQTCADLDGEVCDIATQDCSGGYEDDDAAGLAFGETCCVLGICQAITAPVTNECEDVYSGVCRDFGCESGEKINTLYECADSFQDCCILKLEKKSLWWIWVLIILIILTALAIVYRDKLKEFYLKLEAKKFGPPKGPRRPGIPTMGIPPRRPPRRILPSLRRPAPMRGPPPQARGKTKELDEVLTKLKEMGK